LSAEGIDGAAVVEMPAAGAIGGMSPVVVVAAVVLDVAMSTSSGA